MSLFYSLTNNNMSINNFDSLENLDVIRRKIIKESVQNDVKWFQKNPKQISSLPFDLNLPYGMKLWYRVYLQMESTQKKIKFENNEEQNSISMDYGDEETTNYIREQLEENKWMYEETYVQSRSDDEDMEISKEY